MKSRLLAVLLGLAAASCQVVARTPGAPGAAGEWLELQTPHFTIDTDLSELSALAVARNLEDIRTALIGVAWTGAHNPPRGRIDVVVFRTPAEFDRYSGKSAQVEGIAWSRAGRRRLLSFCPGPNSGIPTVVTHEMAHDLSQWFVPIQPIWFSEGMATFLENTRYDGETGTAVLGGASESRLSWLSHSGAFTPAKDLFEAKTAIDVDARVSASFYASAWLLVHYLLNEDGDRFAAFQSRLAHLQEWQEAWHTSFSGVTPEALDELVAAYLKEGGRFVTLALPVPREAFEPKLRRLSAAEASGVRANLAQNGQPELAEREAARALSLDPSELRALSVRFYALDAAAAEARLGIAQKAVAVHPETADAWFLLAQARAPGPDRAAALQKAHQLEPEHPGVLTLLAEQLVRDQRAAEALPYTRLALQRSPASFMLVQLHLASLVATHQCSDAQGLERNAEQRFAEGCTVTTNGVSTSCQDVLRQAWISTSNACALRVPRSGPSVFRSL
jgi:tetratricopeptide (TPR) repeat protein